MFNIYYYFLFIAYWYFNVLKLLKILSWLTTIGKKFCEKNQQT